MLYVFIFSFNDYRRNNLTWNSDAGPTLKHWANPCGAPGICEALGNSLKVGLLATLVATVLGGDVLNPPATTTDVTLASRYLERFTDHGLSVAAKVRYLVTGEWAYHRGSETSGP